MPRSERGHARIRRVPTTSSSVDGAFWISSKNSAQALVGNLLQSERRRAHLGHAVAHRGAVLGAVVRVQAERHLEFIDRFRGEPRLEDLHEPLQGKMEALDARRRSRSTPSPGFIAC